MRRGNLKAVASQEKNPSVEIGKGVLFCFFRATLIFVYFVISVHNFFEKTSHISIFLISLFTSHGAPLVVVRLDPDLAGHEVLHDFRAAAADREDLRLAKDSFNFVAADDAGTAMNLYGIGGALLVLCPDERL